MHCKIIAIVEKEEEKNVKKSRSYMLSNMKAVVKQPVNFIHFSLKLGVLFSVKMTSNPLKQ